MPADITLDPGIPALTALPAKLASASEAPSPPGQTHPSAQTTSLAAAGPKLANPQLTVDPSTARVVYEYYSNTGVLTNSIPSQQQLQAYRLAAESGEGQASNASQATAKS